VLLSLAPRDRQSPGHGKIRCSSTHLVSRSRLSNRTPPLSHQLTKPLPALRCLCARPIDFCFNVDHRCGAPISNFPTPNLKVRLFGRVWVPPGVSLRFIRPVFRCFATCTTLLVVSWPMESTVFASPSVFLLLSLRHPSPAASLFTLSGQSPVSFLYYPPSRHLPMPLPLSLQTHPYIAYLYSVRGGMHRSLTWPSIPGISRG
jgi:hypothetical protein